eukprot:Gb_17472 [translate_table: standard]
MKMQIRANLQEDSEQSVARYVNGLRFQLQDELALIKIHTVDEAYQYALNAEEKLNRSKGKSLSKKGDSTSFKGKGSSSKSAMNEEPEEGQGVKPNSRVRGGFRGRGRGQTFGCRKPLQYFICGEAHKAIDCPQNPKRAMVAQEEPATQEVEAETGENLMLQGTLITRNKKSPEADWRRKSVFRTRCKCKDKVCKVIVDGGSTDNLVSTEMVQKLQLACIPKSNPYKIS